MLKRIQIKGFRSCKDVTLDGMGYVTALVGPNGSGKTNILEAIDRLARTAATSELTSLVRSALSPTAPPPSFSADLAVGEASYRYTCIAGLEGVNGDRNPTRFRMTLKESLAVAVSGERWERIFTRSDQELRVSGRTEPLPLAPMMPSFPALLALLPDEEALLQHVRPLLSFFRATRYYPFEESNEAQGWDGRTFIPDTEYQRWISQSPSLAQAQDSVLMRLLYAHYEDRALLEEIRSLLGPRGLDLIQHIAFETVTLPSESEGREEKTFHHVRFRLGRVLGGGTEMRRFDELSVGTRRVLRILVSLIVDRNALMLIEHPEEGIHSGLLRKLAGLLRVNANPTQIILSSHSADVLNAFGPKDLRLVTIRRGATAVRALTGQQVEAASRFMKAAGSLAEFLESVEEA